QGNMAGRFEGVSGHLSAFESAGRVGTISLGERRTYLAVLRRTHSSYLGTHVLTETMERRPEIGLDSYDRFFPNQDTLPQGGFGNLIALPLQKRPRESGNSVFRDERFTPFPDQWVFLSSIRRINRSEVEEMVRLAEAKGQVIGVRLPPESDEVDGTPWMAPPSRRKKDTLIAGPLPKTLEVTLGNQIYIAKE